MEKNNLKDGIDHGFAGEVPGVLINRLEDVIEEICNWEGEPKNE